MLQLAIKTGLTKRKTQGCRLSPKRQSLDHSSQSGFTIIESLMAIAVAGILLVGLSPLVALYVGARVQARRIDLANQAARSYIEGLRSGVIPPPELNGANFNTNDMGVNATNFQLPDQTMYPGTCFDANLNTLNSTTCKLPPDGRAYLAIQALRDGPANTAKPDDPQGLQKELDDSQGPQKQGYCLGIRVFRADILNGKSTLRERQDTNTFTANLGISGKLYPLVVMTTQIVNQTSFEEYQNRLNKKSSPCT